MIQFSNGHRFDYMTASGALGYDGKGWFWEKPLRWVGLFDPKLFTSVTKTLTFYPKKGNLLWYNPSRCIKLLPNGIVNAVGLSNPGIVWWCKHIGPFVETRKIPLVVSIFGEPEELGIMAKMLEKFDIVGLEINVSCPNIKTDHNIAKILACCEKVRQSSNLPIILKLSPNHDIEQIVRGIENIVEAFSINSVPWNTVFPNSPSPLKHLGGGVSGKIAQPFTWELITKITQLSSIPVIAPSIWEFKDIEKARVLGAKAISFGSIFLRYPWRPTLYARKDKKN